MPRKHLPARGRVRGWWALGQSPRAFRRMLRQAPARRDGASRFDVGPCAEGN